MTSSTPLVSIVTPVYNAERFLEATIRSVLAQNYQNWELLLVIDFKSKDHSLEIARRFAQQDNRIRVIFDEQNQGVAANRNHGIDEARGAYVAFLDADDLWLPEKLKAQVEFMEQRSVDFSFHSYQTMSEQGEVWGAVRAIRSAVVSYEELLKDNQIGCLTVMLRRSFLGNHRFYAGSHEDLVLWLELLRTGGTAQGIIECLAQYRIVQGSRSNNKILAAAWRWRILREVEKLSWPWALWYFGWYFYFAVVKRSG
jgi:teichuronic acid biosynthesis glycosyltransferase TuaG